MRRTALFSLAGLLFAGITLGEDFWVKKDFTQWTDKEVRRILTNSPWSKETTVRSGGGVWRSWFGTIRRSN
jgi:hypothetical protein